MKTDLFSTEQTAKDVYTVSRLNFEVAGVLAGQFPPVWISGEISNLATPPSGHWYFSLKDAKAQVRCAMFRGKNQQVTIRPENGMQVLLRASIGLYETRGEFQLNVLSMTPAGEGALQQQFEALKKSLQAKGWFDESHKKPLPKLPQTIGLVTSKDGAAIHDMVTTFYTRFPAIQLIVYPSLVQGTQAARQIAKMIALANQRAECDALIVGRGGGSLEDLWAFNEHAVAEAIFNSAVPVVSAVGHESDVSIADLVADFRAATPTAAAQALSPEQHTVAQKITGFARQLKQQAMRSIQHGNQQVQVLQAQLPNPSVKLEQLSQRCDELSVRLRQGSQTNRAYHGQQLAVLQKRLQVQHPATVLQMMRMRLSGLQKRLQAQLPSVEHHHPHVLALLERLQKSKQRTVQHSNQQLATLATRLDTASPLATLARGYAIATDSTGAILKDAADTKPGDTVTVRLDKGRVVTEVK